WSLFSKRAKSERASAVLPAKPARILSLNKRRVFLALCLITVSPRVTCPSAASTTLLSLRTHKTVVPCIWDDFPFGAIPRLYSAPRGMENRGWVSGYVEILAVAPIWLLVRGVFVLIFLFGFGFLFGVLLAGLGPQLIERGLREERIR